LRTAQRAIARSGRIIRWGVGSILFLLFAGIPAVMFVHFVLFSPSGIGMPGLAILFPLFFGAMLTLGVLRGNFAYGRNAIVQAMLASRLCPACAEDLSGRRP